MDQDGGHLEYLEEAIGHLNEEIRTRLHSFEAELAHLDTVPGIARAIAEVALAELGTDMTRFPTERHCASWSGLCPGQDESAGKRRSGKTRKGSPALRGALIQAAHAAARTKGTYLSAQYHRLAARRGKKRAAVAVAHTILTIIYHILRTDRSYEELGGNFFDERDHKHIARPTRDRPPRTVRLPRHRRTGPSITGTRYHVPPPPRVATM